MPKWPDLPLPPTAPDPSVPSHGEGGEASPSPSLHDANAAHDNNAHDAAWIEVVRKMEEVYSDLIQYEVELEEKNAALEEAQRFITSVLSSVSDILVVCDDHGRIRQVNLAFLRLIDRAEVDLLGTAIDVLLADHPEPLRHWLETGQDHEVRFVAGSGEATEPVALSGSTLLDHRGLPAGIVLSGRPVGELRRAYEALKRAQAQLVQQEKMASLGRLIAGVAHELNNPISFIVGNVHVLERYRDRLLRYLAALHDGSPAAAMAGLRRDLRIDPLMDDLPALIAGIQEGAQRVADIVKSLKRLSFSSTGETEEVSVADLAAKTSHWVAKGRGADDILILDIPDDLCVRGHAGQLHQVLANMVENALDAVKDRPAPKVVVAGRRRGKLAEITVSDNGPGIPQDALLKIFDPFFTTKPVGQGTGLGLWISYGIVRDHGGEMHAENRPEGGARMILTLPAIG